MIIYYVKKGQSFVDLCNEVQLENPDYLRDYHNQKCSLSERLEDDLTPGMKLYIPSSKEILEINKIIRDNHQSFYDFRRKGGFLSISNSGKVIIKLLRLPIQMRKFLQSMKAKSSCILKELKMSTTIFSFQR
ncbi:hypothetical protein BOQ64_05090 [Chryseobacterium sp. CH25]|nr:hypothetical protein BOQ64_05090 [Chryseobacterium sp. CH25]